MQGLIDTASGYLDQARDPATSLADASSLVQDANQLGNTAYDLLQKLEGATADEIPHQIVSPFQRWVTGLGIGNTIFFRADHVANYELATFHLEKMIRNLNAPSQTLLDATAAVDWPFLRLTVPSQAMGMLPHFAIVGHELGHAIQEQIRPDLTAHTAAAQQSLQRTIDRLKAEGLQLDAQAQLRRQGVLGSWMNEIRSDAVGHYLAGPAFLFALGAFFELSGGGWGIGMSHPPSVLRRKLVVHRLRQGTPSHASVFESATTLPLSEDMNSPHLIALPAPDDLYNALRPRLGSVDAAICVELVPLIEAIADEFYAEAERELQRTNPDMIYTPERLDADLSNHLEALCVLVPPIEHREAGVAVATTLAGILNVGWAALLAKLGEIGTAAGAPDNAAATMERLQALLLKAVELSDARLIWESTP